MEPALKQRLIGAMVLVALAVIFLPMLIKGPAPASGASDVPLTLPDQPQGSGDLETRELPRVTPGDAPQGGVVGMDHPTPATGPTPGGDGQTLPTVDTAAGNQGMLPASTAGGDYAVSFGSYASPYNALRIAKGVLWAGLFVALLHRLGHSGHDARRAFASGMTWGLAYVVVFIVWERLAFVGLFDLADAYRVTRPEPRLSVAARCT